MAMALAMRPVVQPRLLPTSEGSRPPAPIGDLYQPPTPLPPGPPGRLIGAQVVTRPPIDPPSTIWRILYHSRDRVGRDVAVSGFAIVPDAPLPAGLAGPCMPGRRSAAG